MGRRSLEKDEASRGRALGAGTRRALLTLMTIPMKRPVLALLLSLAAFACGPEEPELEAHAERAVEPEDEKPLAGLSKVVGTTEGPVRGYRHGGAWAWRGIPFAAPPERWRAPRPPAVRSGTLDAASWGNQCMQDPGGGGSPYDTVAMSEDCLYLNVWTPAATGNRPVMVWIHGGGFAVGSPAQPVSMGDRLALEQD